MRRVGVRDFFRKPYEQIKDLPFLVTKNDVPILVVSDANEYKALFLAKKQNRLCQIQLFKHGEQCKAPALLQYHVSFYGDGEPVNMDLFLCDAHADEIAVVENAEITPLATETGTG